MLLHVAGKFWGNATVRAYQSDCFHKGKKEITSRNFFSNMSNFDSIVAEN